MGRPKALRQREVTPAISIDVNIKSTKHISFGDDDSNIDVIEKEETISSDNKSDNNIKIMDNKPEIISSNSDEILKLKDLYEKMVEPLNKKLKRKRKANSVKSINQDLFNNNNDNDLDTTVLEYLSKNGLEYEKNNNNNEDSNVINHDGNDQDDIKSIFKVNSKKINSNMEVELIGDSSLRSNPLSTFKLSDSVILFQKNNFNKVERVPYANFISQKKHKPSKLFGKAKK